MSRLFELLGPPTPLTAYLADELREVDRIFRAQLQSDLPPVNRLCSHLERYRGKMLRPALTLLSGVAAAGDRTPAPSEPLRILAAVVEMIHMATLVHDDVLDEASLRRKGATVNYLHGNEAAVLLGDYLISNAFHLCSSLGRPEINRRIGAVTNATCAGELLQLHHRGHWSLDEATYFTIIERKTAELIRVSCELAAVLTSAAPPVVAALAEYGFRLGVAFQIQDDIIDLSGQEQVVGKNVAKDLEMSKPTLPVIWFLAAAEPPQREAMLSLLTGPKSVETAGRVRELLDRAGSLDHAARCAADHVGRATAALDQVPHGPGRTMLLELAHLLSKRDL